MTMRELEKVLYCEAYTVTESGKTDIPMGTILTEEEYHDVIDEHGPGALEAGMGGEAIRDLLKNLDLVALTKTLREEMVATSSEAKRKKYAKRLKVAEAIRDSDNCAEWLMLK